MSIAKKAVFAAASALKAASKLSRYSLEQKPSPVEKSRPSVAGVCYTVGFGKCDILPRDLPEKTYYIAGYGANKPAVGVLDPPYAHAVYIDDNSGLGGVVFISIDDVGMLNSDVSCLRRKLDKFCEKTGCRSVNVMSTHSHAGIDTMGIWGKLPFTGRNPKYMQQVFDSAVKAVETAFEQRKNGDLYIGNVEVPDMQEDIRLPEVYSKTLTRLRFVPHDGGREIYMLNFASHSESLQGSNKLVSADFPAYMRQEIAEKAGADTIYFVGAIGGMISMKLLSKNYVESTKGIGRKLAGYALKITDEKKLEPKISFARCTFGFAAENLVLMAAQKLRILQAKAYRADWAPLGWALKSEMTYFEIGSQKLLLLPCELFPELAYGGYLDEQHSANKTGAKVNPVPLCEIAGDDGLLFFGLANDEIGYVIPPNDFLLDAEQPYLNHARDYMNRKHYEETNSLGPQTAPRIAEIFKYIIDEFKA